MTETISNQTTTSLADWHKYPDAYGTWVNPQGKLYHFNRGVDHDTLSLAKRGPWLRLNEADISRVRDTWYKPFQQVSKHIDQLENGLRD